LFFFDKGLGDGDFFLAVLTRQIAEKGYGIPIGKAGIAIIEERLQLDVQAYKHCEN